MLRKLVILYSLSFLMLFCVAHIAFTNLKCQFAKKELGRYRECFIKAVNRTHKYINIYCEIYQKPLSEVTVNIKLLRKDNGYKPYLVNITFDGCKFLRNQRNPVVNIFFRAFRASSNLNRTCPLYDDIIINKFWTGNIDDEFIKFFPIPNGEYAVFATFYTNNQEMSSVNTYVTVNRKN